MMKGIEIVDAESCDMNEETLFHQALAIADSARRAAFLAEACADQPELRQAVEALLSVHAASGHPLDQPPGNSLPMTGSLPPPVPLAATGPFSSKEAQPGLIIAGRYTLVEKIGEGGMGEVWVARQTDPVKRKVALKLIKPGMDSKAVLQCFEHERKALAMMDHPNIARVLDGGVTRDLRPFFVMELVNGLPLTQYCDEVKLAPRERLALFIPICHAVQHAHHKGIVHRDLKPSNILVTLIDGRPVPKVIDFGVAKAVGGKLTEETLSTHFGAVVGTLEYMAPEQAGYSGQDVDSRADLYSLGVILYELLTGLKPFDVKRLKQAAFDEIQRMIREEDPPSLASRLSTEATLPSLAALRQIEPRRLIAMVKGELDWIVRRCLEKDRDRRYETASGLARDVEHYLHDEPVEARPVSAGYRMKKFLRRHRGPVIAGVLFLLALVAGIVGTSWGLTWALRAEGEARRDRDRATHLAQAAQEASEEALRSAIANRRLYDRTMLERGFEEERQGDLLTAMQWYLEPLRTPHPHPENRQLHLLCLELYLRHAALPRLSLHLSHEDSVSYAEFSRDGRWLLTVI